MARLTPLPRYECMRLRRHIHSVQSKVSVISPLFTAFCPSFFFQVDHVQVGNETLTGFGQHVAGGVVSKPACPW